MVSAAFREETAPTSRSRSMTGCTTCRRRHTKCDERRPSCSTCETLNIACEGYQINLIFDLSQSVRSGCRRPLFTMEMREAMSEMLTASVESGDVDQCLSQVDRATDELESWERGDFMAEHGPFGAFRISNTEAEPATTSITPMYRSPTVSAALSPPMTESIPNINDIFSEDPLMECLFWDFDLPTDLQHGALFNSNLSPTNYDETNTFCTPHSMPNAPAMGSPSSPLTSNLAPANAGVLLLHYKENVIRFFSPIYSNKTPWQIMHVPIAMETFAQLSLGEFAPSTKMCIFYSVLATSAFALRASSSQEHGGEAYALQAQNYIKIAIRDATSTPKRVKYKDMLIALLCMATAWAYQGNELRIEGCFLDCEQWISLRGVPKQKKSRKVRLLHHCYLCPRVFYESTSVCRKPVSPVNNPSGAFFRRQQWADRFEQRMNERKGGPSVENDMHFEVPGRWDSSMYPEIYGVPESLLFSLAHVTRLANEKDISNSNQHDHSLDMKQFFERASSLEKYICAWRPPAYPPQGENPTEEHTLGQLPHDLLIIHMITAFHKALLIFFYRRIYDVDASILQENVRHVQYLLSQCDKFDVLAIRVATPFLWVAFIASCEALDLTLQNWFSDWFHTSAQKANLPVFQVVNSVIQEVWRRRNKGEYGSWPVVLREMKQNLFYI